MSRTDKDTPHRVISRWVPEHTGCPETTPGRWGWPRRGPGPCDLPPGPPQHKQEIRIRVHARPVAVKYPCLWVADWPDRWADRRYRDAHQGGVPRWYRHAEWFGPDRARQRTQLGRAVAEHRATGEVDIVPTVDQHRRGCGWDWY